MMLVHLGDQPVLADTKKFPHGNYPFEKFNQVQSRILEIHDRDCNCVIAAPTGVGKTVCAEMFMCDEVRRRGGKAIYLAPLRALAKEKIDEWTSEGSVFAGMKISICTGDYRLTEARMKELDSADIIIMTSEMINSRCRNLDSEKNEFLKNCGTLVIDEAHLLTVPSRGDHLEVGLMKFSQVARDPRIVMLSATMPNVDEIANWVGCSLVRKETYLVTSEYRPCPLTIHWEEYESAESYELTEEYKVDKAVEIVRRYKDDKFLVFVHSKATGERVRHALKERRIECEFHSADLDKEQRHDVEKKFKYGDLRVIVATSTLAWGCYRHGERVVMHDGSLKDVSQVSVGDRLLCPTDSGFKPRKVVRSEDFKAEKGYFVKLECGDEMVVSEDHVFLAAKDRSTPGWTEVGELSKRDFIAVPSDLGMWRDTEYQVDDFWYLVGFVFGDGCLVDVGHHADGSKKLMLDICLGRRDRLADFVADSFEREFEFRPRMRDDSNGVPHLVTKKKCVTSVLAKHLPVGRKRGKDDIPAVVCRDQMKARSFLRGLFDSDGGVENHSNGNMSVGFTNISRTAVESIRTLLLCFGIRSSFGRNKMKISVINGRIQKPVRKYVYRIRIFGSANLSTFERHIGFGCPRKADILKSYLKLKLPGFSKDLIPARGLIVEHLQENGTTARDFKGITRCDLWNSVNTQDCNRKTILKLLDSTKKRTALNDLVDKPYFWSRIKDVRKCKGGIFREIEIEDPHAYVGSGAISHNCNFPSRRVVITGVHRGTTEVETYDIFQMAGRAGRPGFDPEGDVHILLPDRGADHHKERLSEPKRIESQLLSHVGGDDDPHYKTLAFHLVSEIHHGNIRNAEDVHSWYEKSLAYFQYESLEDSVVDSTLELLMRVGAVRETAGKFEVTSVGKVSSMLYYSPFDVADLRRNFRYLFGNGLGDNDLAVAMALGNVDSIRCGFVTRAEKDEMESFVARVRKASGDQYTDSAIKGGYAYYCLLNGLPLGPFTAMARGLQMDFDRQASVLNMLDSMAAKWNKRDFFSTLSMRVSYGVRPELVDLCKLPNIGRVRAERLFAAGIRRPSDLARDPHRAQKLLNLKEERFNEIMRSIRSS